MTRKKKARKKGKPLRQSWRDLVSWWTAQKVAKAKRLKQANADAKARAKADAEKAAEKAKRDRLKAESRAKKDAERAAQRAAEQQAATERAQQRAAARGPVRIPGTIIQTGAGGAATLCGHPHITDPRQKCGNPVLPGTMACAAGHPQGASSFGGPPVRRVVNQHDPQPGWAAR